ncbi:Uncharacterised protein [Kluyvera intermedia]|nr:Uncharacterised protein [Kluyvera intermedia]
MPTNDSGYRDLICFGRLSQLFSPDGSTWMPPTVAQPWQRWVFKPITLILLLLLAWQAPMFNAISYLVLAGLVRFAGR